MGIIIQPAMFAAPGLDRIPTNNTTQQDLIDIIAEWETYYLYKLLSNNLTNYPAGGLADLFIADANANAGIPATARFNFIYKPFNIQYGDVMHSSKGMVRTFKSLLYYHYVTEILSAYIGTGGVTSGSASSGKDVPVDGTYRQAESRWNDAIQSIRAIIWWIQVGNQLPAVGGGGGGSVEYPEYTRPSTHDKAVFKAKYQSLL